VANLPTTQTKLRELKEEHDALRAELRKLQDQSLPTAAFSPSYISPGNVPMQMHSPASSEEYPREPKRLKLSATAMEDYVSRSLSTYLASAFFQVFFRAPSPESL